MIMMLLQSLLQHIYRKSSIKPPGGLFNFQPSRGGLIREEGEGLFTKSSEKNIFGSFSFLIIPYFPESTYNFTTQIHKFNTVFIPTTFQN